MATSVPGALEMPETFAGQFLVATPLIADPPFARTVLLLLEHDESGAIALILNNATDLLAEDHVEGIEEHLTEPPRVFLGGPVSSETAVSLGRGRGFEFLRPSALPGIGIVDVDRPLQGIDDLRIFAGYAGWDADQLDAEIREGAWWVLFPDLDEIFTAHPSGMWERTVERGPGTVPLYATFPSDPSAN